VIGKLIDLSVERRTGSPLFAAKEAGEQVFKTPPSWVLMRQPAAGPEKAEMIAESARSFDLASDGSVIYSNGFDVYRMPTNGGPAAKILAVENIDFIAAV
jgi:hypothetical protein